MRERRRNHFFARAPALCAALVSEANNSTVLPQRKCLQVQVELKGEVKNKDEEEVLESGYRRNFGIPAKWFHRGAPCAL